ncbi:MAG: helix-turn-helix transcriptional regulator [bacterium]|nr:helix-turn-helix transcriptional regulator [bacterium]
MTKVSREGRSEVLAIVFLAAILILVVTDLLADWGTGVRLSHLFVEAGMALVAAGGVTILIVRLRSLGREQRELLHQLSATQDEARRWRGETSDLLNGLAAAMDRQFDRWQLTPAERDVALLLMRGLSHKQVARVRRASERTVRQQAHLLYRKAGLANRADLAAFFLDGLLRPRSSKPAGSG